MTRNLAPAVAAAVKAAGVKRRTVDHADTLDRLLGHEAPGRVREHPFAKVAGRQFRFDLAWPGQMVAVEIHGGTFSGGRHTRGATFERDCEKMRYATLLGWRVLAFTGDELKRAPDMVLVVIRAALENNCILTVAAADAMNEASKAERQRVNKRAKERRAKA